MIELPQMRVLMNKASESDIVEYISFHRKLFLSDFDKHEKIVEYSRKFRKYANTYELWYDGKLDALLVAYFSESLKQIYVPYFCTAGSHYRPHPGQYLFQMISGFSAPFDFIRLEVRNDNQRAMDFYLKQGFCVKKENGEKLLMEKALRQCNELF